MFDRWLAHPIGPIPQSSAAAGGSYTPACGELRFWRVCDLMKWWSLGVPRMWWCYGRCLSWLPPHCRMLCASQNPRKWLTGRCHRTIVVLLFITYYWFTYSQAFPEAPNLNCRWAMLPVYDHDILYRKPELTKVTQHWIKLVKCDYCTSWYGCRTAMKHWKSKLRLSLTSTSSLLLALLLPYVSLRWALCCLFCHLRNEMRWCCSISWIMHNKK